MAGDDKQVAAAAANGPEAAAQAEQQKMMAATNQMAAVIMRAVQNAQRKLYEDLDAPAARGMAENADKLCDKAGAPPPVHGLVLRVLGDACMACKDPDAARAALTRGAQLNASAADKKGLHPRLRMDALARLGDLKAALGEVERADGQEKASIRFLRQAAAAFERMGPAGVHFAAAAHNRCAAVLVEQSDFDGALEELDEAVSFANKSESSGPQLRAQAGLNRGACLRARGDLTAAYTAWKDAEVHAAEANAERIMEELTAAMEEVMADPNFVMPAAEGATKADESAFL